MYHYRRIPGAPPIPRKQLWEMAWKIRIIKLKKIIVLSLCVGFFLLLLAYIVAMMIAIHYVNS